MAEGRITVLCTGTCFLTALILVIVALSFPSWVVHDFHGLTQFGLFTTCKEQRYNQQTREFCGDGEPLPVQWTVAAVFILFGVLSLVVSMAFVCLAFAHQRFLDHSKWAAFVAATVFSLASLIFPIGFDGEPIGGKAFKLPEHSSVGFSYIIFIVALVLVFVGELFAMKILCPID